ncbi:MAG: hypothetical protein AB1547_14970, partial [Thermodesulfobacteriota bacterium]
PACIHCLAIRPILRDRAAEFFRSSEKGSPVTPRLDRDFLTFCGAIMKNNFWIPLMIAIMLLAWLPAIGLSQPPQHQAQPPLQATRFIAYTPRSFSVVRGNTTPATADGIRADLLLMKPWFDGIVTYSATNGLELVPRIARELGYREVLLGIWDPISSDEMEKAYVEIARTGGIVTGVIVGNEGMYAKRYHPQAVLDAQAKIRHRFPNLPVSTSEPFFLMVQEEHRAFFASQSFLAPNIHPIFEPWFQPERFREAAEMVLSVARKLQAVYPGKTVLIHETGMPSGPDQLGYSPEGQKSFWKQLHEMLHGIPGIRPVVFEAFDAPWKPGVMAETFPGNHSSESFWGFWDTRGVAKPVLHIYSPDTR